MSEKPMIKFRKGDAFTLSDDQRARLDALTDDEVEAGALDDPEAQPVSADHLERMLAAREVRLARQATGLSQIVFAKVYRFKVGRLRDLEQGRTRADSAIEAYLTAIRRDPDAVKRLLA